MDERGVDVFSISDHDTLAAYGAFTPRGTARVVVGIEINTTYRENEVHVLGYGITPDHPQMCAMIERNIAERRKRIDTMISRLQRAGYSITFEDVAREAGVAKALGRPHVGKALVRAGMAPDLEWVFRNLLRGGKPGYVPSKHVTPQEAIETISRAGGVAVLAHPGRLKDRAIINELAECGLHGLEVFYPRHDGSDIAAFRAFANRHGLVMTAGSDFHDIRYHAHGVGMVVDDADIAPFLDLVL